MRVLVCGGRDYADEDKVCQVLDDVNKRTPVWLLIHGGAKGADMLAARWAWTRDVAQDRYEADWKQHGKAAGPLRNQQMIDKGKPDLVIAFPGGRGTADMVRRAKTAGVPVTEVAPPHHD